jgi:hypothetical protein
MPAPAGHHDILWRLGTVLKGTAWGSNTSAQGIVIDKLIRPQALEQLVAGDEAVAMRYEIGKGIEGVRSQMDE